MAKNIFMSYSRREVGFVDDLAGHLEQKGFNFWLDYRSLVPGKPWAEQISQGITNADIVLLVVTNDRRLPVFEVLLSLLRPFPLFLFAGRYGEIFQECSLLP